MLRAFRRNRDSSMTDMRGSSFQCLEFLIRSGIIHYFFSQCHISLQELAAQRKAKLEASLSLQQFYRDVDEEEAWIRYEMMMLVAKHTRNKADGNYFCV